MDESEVLFKLERELLDPVVRKNKKQLEILLDSNFFEFGSSGRHWSRDEILRNLLDEKSEPVEASNFEAHHLSDDTVLVTYRTNQVGNDGHNKSCLRSSIWKNSDGKWRLYFHQGTVTGNS